MKKTLKAILFLMVPVFTLSLFACKAETETEYVEVEKIVEVEKKPDSTPPQKIIAGENAAKAGNACVLLSWKNPADEDFYGTKITFVPAAEGVTQPLVILGEKSKDSSALIRGLDNGTEYTFSLFALDKTHNEAQKVELKAAPVDSSDMSPPAEVAGLKSVATAGRIGLIWNDPKDEDLFGIEITYKESSAMTRSLAKMEEKSVFAAPGLQYIEVPNLANGTEYTFTVKTMDTSGNKGSGVTVKATPVAVDSKEPLKIDLSVPPEKSNKAITITANITTAAQIVDRVVYKKDGSEVASKLLADSSAIPAVKGSTDRTWTFEIKATDETANGTYTVAAIDSDGREETAQIAISNFDFTAPKVASGLPAALSTDKTSVTLTWKDPTDEDFDHVEICFVSNDGTSDSEKSETVEVEKGVQTKDFAVDPSKAYYEYYIVTVDTLGNKSSGIPIKVYVAAVSKIPEGFVEIPATSISGTEKWTPASTVFVSGRNFEIASLYMSDHVVTRGEYKAVMESDPSEAKAYDKDGNELTGDDNVKNNPVNNISWYDALVYCNTLSIKEGLTPCYAIGGKTDPSKWGAVPTGNDSTWNAATCDSKANGYRLPTEAEWECAARGGGESYTYAGSNDVDDVAWYNTNGTRDVKTKKANAYGLYDMSGNVWEWCWDWYGSISSGTPDAGPASGSYRCQRGGSWYDSASSARVVRRSSDGPYNRGSSYGFRLVRNAR